MTRYVRAWTWTRTVGEFIEEIVKERPSLNVCSGNVFFGDVRVDAHHPFPDVRADACHLPFKPDSFASVFADPPWQAGWKRTCADFCREAMRVSPILYLMAPWIWGSGDAQLTDAWVRQMPGINNAIVVSRYQRKSFVGPVPQDGQGESLETKEDDHAQNQ